MAAIEMGVDPRRILIIKPSALGDIVHALPILNLLRHRWPAAHISWLVTPAFAGLIEGHPQLDEVIRFERRRFGRGWRSPAAATGFLQFVSALRKKKFDLVIDLQGLFRSGWLAWSTGAPRRIGFADAREAAWVFYTHRIKVQTIEQHALDRYLSITDALGCEREPIVFRLPDALPLDEAIDRPYAVLLPGTNWDTKRWPTESFAGLVRPLRERFGLQTVLAGARDAVPLAAEIRKLTSGERVIDLTGKTSLRQLVGLLGGAAVVVANDSGPMHIASALGRPMVALFGPTNPIRTGPYGRMDTVMKIEIPCSPCYSRRCSHCSCLRWVEVERVLDGVSAQLEGEETACEQAG